MRQLAILLLMLTGSCTGVASAEPEQFELENGMKVVLRPVPEASHVALVVLFDIGGDHDPLGQSGLAHTIEHVYVTAAAGTTKARTVQEYVAAYPHGWNAQTGNRYTVIATLFETTALDAELWDAAARMQDLRVTQADLDREKPRIRSELHNMYAGIPQLAAMNLAREMVCPSAPGHRKGGMIDQISMMTMHDVQSRWQRYYKPNNTILVLAGPLDVVEARRKVQHHFAPIEPGDPPPNMLKAAKPTLGKTLTVKVTPIRRNAKAQVCLAYPAPHPSDEVFPAFLVLVAKMQSRARELQTTPRHFPVQFMGIDDPSILYLSSAIRAGKTAEETIQGLQEFADRIANEKVGKADLELTKNTFAFLFGTAELPVFAGSANIYGVAFALGRRRQLGIDSKQLAEAIGAVDEESIARCREQVFGPSRRGTVVVTLK